MKLAWLGALGAVLGTACAAVVFAPATWLSSAVAQATDGHVILAQPRGSVWTGSAVLTLAGGEGSKDASALPGRVSWRMAPSGLALVLSLRHECCLTGEQSLRVQPGWGTLRLEFKPADAVSAALGQWPASWLVGLGTPFNTLQPSGLVQISSPGFAFESASGRWHFSGNAQVQLSALASRVSTLPELGHYRVLLSGDPSRNEPASLLLSTLSGALQLNGSGQWAGPKLRFRGQASAAPGAESALSNLLNIIGRRQGPVAVISIG